MSSSKLPFHIGDRRKEGGELQGEQQRAGVDHEVKCGPEVSDVTVGETSAHVAGQGFEGHDTAQAPAESDNPPVRRKPSLSRHKPVKKRRERRMESPDTSAAEIQLPPSYPRIPSPYPKPREEHGADKSPVGYGPSDLNYLHQGNVTSTWGPIKPGYSMASQSDEIMVPGLPQRPVSRQSGRSETDANLKDFIPRMPRALAVCCLVLNVFAPGLGTATAGFSVFCCSRPRRGYERCDVAFVNTCVGVLQLASTALCLLGWVWSVTWGIKFLSFTNDKPEDSPRPRGENPLEAAIRRASVDAMRHSGRHVARHTMSHTHGLSNDDYYHATIPTISETVHHPPMGRAMSSGLHSPSTIIILQQPPLIVQRQGRSIEEHAVGSHQRTLTHRERRMLREEDERIQRLFTGGSRTNAR